MTVVAGEGRLNYAARALIYDTTHLALRAKIRDLTGIDRVDLNYAVALAGADSLACSLACALHYGWRRPHLITPARFRAFVHLTAHSMGETLHSTDDPAWRSLRSWLTGAASEQAAPEPRPSASMIAPPGFFQRAAFHLADDYQAPAPQGAVYLNVAQAGLEYPRFFTWLRNRPDITPVFMIHDLLPLSRPDYFPAGYRAVFERRLATIFTYAKGLILTSEVVSRQVEDAYRRRGQAKPPLCVLPLPSPLSALPDERDRLADPALAQTVYFVMTATLEPRKNHALLLRLWPDLPPDIKLVLVGAPGRSSSSILSQIQANAALASRIRHVSGLSRAALGVLIANARAVLAPSHAEGYGLPVVEALSLGARVIASDIPIFHEVSQGRGLFCDPADPAAWTRAIMSCVETPTLEKAALASVFTPPRWDSYFAGVQAFLRRL